MGRDQAGDSAHVRIFDVLAVGQWSKELDQCGVVLDTGCWVSHDSKAVQGNT